MSNRSSKHRSHRASTEATTKVRPSARIKTRAPPRRGKKNRKGRRQSTNFASVAAANHVGTQPQQDTPGHFHDLMESLCTNHDYPVKHLYKDCQLLKRLLR